MIEIHEKSHCCGCSACANACPVGCISMKADEEGFLYPQIDSHACIECDRCEKVCPCLNPIDETRVKQSAYLIQHKNETVRKESTAGGAFSAIGSYILQQNGVVFGAAYDKEFQVHHTYVETEPELSIFRNSKYVQSKMGNSFKIAKHFLDEGRLVCFSGTPCQIEGLNKYLGREHENLILVDVVCHGIPSPLVWKKYLEFQRVNETKPDNIRFRDKYYGYKYSTMSHVRQKKIIYHAGAQKDSMLRAFFSDICDRPACYNCLFKKRYRVSDITLWDCFSVYSFDKKMDDDKGTTRVLCHTQKGTDIIDSIKGAVNCIKVDSDKLVYGVNEMTQSVEVNKKRDKFFEDAQRMSGETLFQTYFPVTTTIRIKTLIRKILLITGMYGFMKKCLNIIKGR